MKSWAWVIDHKEHILFLFFCFIVGGLGQDKRIALIPIAFVILIFVLLAAWRLGRFALLVGLLSSAIVSERIPSEKKFILILFFAILGLGAGLFFSGMKKGKEDTRQKIPDTQKAENKKEEEKKISYEKEVPCKFCGRLISKAELECPYCRKKQYDLHEINTLLEKKSRIREALDNLELRFMNGEVDDETYKSLKKKWNVRLADIEEKIISSQMKH